MDRDGFAQLGCHATIGGRFRMSGTFTDLRVWQNSMALAVAVHHCTASFPRRATYGLAIQMERAAISIPSNIAEGKGRRTDKDALNFFYTARGSLYELETQVILARELEYLKPDQAEALVASIAQVGSGLTGLIHAFAKGIATGGGAS